MTYIKDLRIRRIEKTRKTFDTKEQKVVTREEILQMMIERNGEEVWVDVPHHIVERKGMTDEEFEEYLNRDRDLR